MFPAIFKARGLGLQLCHKARGLGLQLSNKARGLGYSYLIRLQA